MKRNPWLSCIAVLALSVIPTILAHAIWSVIYIHELVEKSDIVFFGRVTGTQFVIGDPTSSIIDTLEDDGGFLFTIRIDRVLYAEEKIKQAIFSESDLKKINKKLKRQPEDQPGNPSRVPVRSGSVTRKVLYFQRRRTSSTS